jgi:hypothetical protein
LNITKDLLRSWSACADGYAYFLEHWSDGSTYAAVQAKLREDRKTDWSVWLTAHVWEAAIADPSSSIAALAQAEVDEAITTTKDSPNSASGYFSKAASSGNYSKAASSGDRSKAASSGNYSTAASSGDGSTAASSGDGSTAASSGDGSTAASSGYGSTAASSGCGSMAASSGDCSKAASSGYGSTAASSGYGSTAAVQGANTIAMVAGLGGQAKAGPNGCIALCWYDGKRNRIVAGYVGEEGIEADTLYRVADGKLVKVRATKDRGGEA